MPDLLQEALTDPEAARKRGKPIRGGGRPDKYMVGKSRVPGVTTITGRFADKGGLMFWAFEQGKAAERGEIQRLYDQRDAAAECGKIAHNMVEAWLHGDDPQTVLQPWANYPDTVKKAQQAFDMFMEWLDRTRIQIVLTEYSVIDEELMCGGTLDAIGVDDKGRHCLLDWKTGSGLYPDMLIQVAAYAELWNRQGNAQIEGGVHVCRFSKETPDFHHHFYGAWADEWQSFQLMRECYELDKRIKKRT